MTFEMPQITTGFYVAIAFILLFIFVLIYVIKNNNIDTDVEYDGNNKELIIELCKKYVCNNLKCPLTANFSNINIISQDKYGRVFIDVFVDSQNSFGAMVRTNLGVVLYPYEKSYKVTDCGICKYSSFKTEDIIKRINNWNKPL